MSDPGTGENSVTPQESNRLARSLRRIMQDAGEDLRIFVCGCGYVAFRIGHHADLADRGQGWQIEPHTGCHGCGNVPPCPACGASGAGPVWDPFHAARHLPPGSQPGPIEPYCPGCGGKWPGAHCVCSSCGWVAA